MKGIIRGRRKRKFNGHTYYYYSLTDREERTIEREELDKLSRELPVRCQKLVRRADVFKVPMTPKEQEDMLLLCSLSIYCWNGGPRCNLPGISMEDYTNDFYIEMSGVLLRSWNAEKGPWPAYVKFVRLKTIDNTIKRWERINSSMEVKRFHAIDRENFADRGWDNESLQLGTTVSEGRAVRNVNPR